MKRIITMLTLAALLVAALTITSAGAFAAPPPCEPGDPGCKTVEGKNPKFTQSQRGNLNAPGTESTETCTKPCPPGQFK
jgi:hypothetical protein